MHAVARRGVNRISRHDGRAKCWLVFILLSLLFGCSSSPPPNILVIVIDTLRADRADFYDTHRDLTPFLASLADHGTVFWRAYAQSSWTLPSVASLWTSRYQSQHNVTTANSVLADTERTLAEVLHERGYLTGGFSANTLVTKQRGFGQGFDQYDAYLEDTHQPRKPFAKEPADRLNQRSLAWLDTHWVHQNSAAPVFLYLQYMEPHAPYMPPPEILERLMSRHANADELRQTYGDMLFVHHERWERPDAEALSVIRDTYDAEVMSLDGHIRELFAELGQRGFLRNAIVVITADHGEELMDHGALGHCKTLYDEVIRVPLLLVTPNQRERLDVHSVVSLIDIAPTVLGLSGIPVPASFEGRPLGAFLQPPHQGNWLSAVAGIFHQPESEAPAAYSELLHLPSRQKVDAPRHVRTLVVDSHKLILGGGGGIEAYDLGLDPGETNPDGLNPTDRRALQQTLETVRQRATRNASAPQTRPLDERDKERMRALGYVVE